MATLTINASLAQHISKTSQATYSAAHDASSGDIGTGTSFFVASRYFPPASPLYDVYRGYLTFDTSSLFGAPIVSASLTPNLFCFPGDTLVHTPKGPTRIDNLSEGELVWSVNLLTGKSEPQEVVKIFRSVQEHFLVVETGQEFLIPTPLHPFMVMGKGWVRAAALRVGDSLFGKSGEPVVTTSLAAILGAREAYDLSVLRNNNYFVGRRMVLVHNKTEEDVGQGTLHVVQGVHGDTLSVSDFGSLKAKTVSGGSLSLGTIILNPTGIRWISKIGTTKLGLRLSGDIDNSTPTGNNVLWIWGIGAGGPPYLTIETGVAQVTRVIEVLRVPRIQTVFLG